MGFHAPQEAARILGEAIDYARQGELSVRKLGVKFAEPEILPPRVEAAKSGSGASDVAGH